MNDSDKQMLHLSGDIAGFKLAVCNSQFGKRFDSLRMSFCVISKNCKSLKSDTSYLAI